MHLKHYEFLTKHIEELEKRIAEHMAPYKKQLRLLCRIPGVQQVAAWSLLAELGPDMSVFPSSSHCASWAGLCPGENESAGVIKSSRTKGR